MPETVYSTPHPLIRRAAARLIAISLLLALIACLAQIVLALSIAPLFIGTAFFTAVLTVPLLLQSVLHPEVITTRDGLILRPMLWRSQAVPWTAIRTITAHPLIYNDEVVGRHLHGKHYRPREGMIIVLRWDTAVLPLYRLVGSVAGVGNVPAFGISSTTHKGYEELLACIQSHLEISG